MRYKIQDRFIMSDKCKKNIVAFSNVFWKIGVGLIGLYMLSLAFVEVSTYYDKKAAEAPKTVVKEKPKKKEKKGKVYNCYKIEFDCKVPGLNDTIHKTFYTKYGMCGIGSYTDCGKTYIKFYNTKGTVYRIEAPIYNIKQCKITKEEYDAI